MAIDGRTPCIVGVAQHTIHPEAGPAAEPLELWADVCASAVDDAGAVNGSLLASVESIHTLYCQSWPYDDPAGRLAARLGIAPALRTYSGIGGTTPHVLVHAAAESIGRGERDVAIVVGGEALNTVRQAKKSGERLPWSFRDPEKKPFPFEAPFHPAEVAHEVFQAWLTFALFDVARRHHLGVPPAAYREALGQMLAPMTEVAEANPHAWFRSRRSAGELVTPGPDNRLVGYPYTKSMVAIMDVDMAAALVLTSSNKADELGIPIDRRVYIRSGCTATDPTYVAEHPSLFSSPAMEAAATAALRAAGVGVDDIAHFDLYSCFASSVLFACDALGIEPGDPRGLTVTGGLPFAGGPGSGYMLHSIASMVDVLRRDPGSAGVVSGVGMHMTKHAFGVYSTTPPSRLAVIDETSVQDEVDARESRPITSTWDGPASIATYSVVHDRTGEAVSGLAVCDLADGSRTYARFDDPTLLGQVEAEEWVGSAVSLTSDGAGVNRLL